MSLIPVYFGIATSLSLPSFVFFDTINCHSKHDLIVDGNQGTLQYEYEIGKNGG